MADVTGENPERLLTVSELADLLQVSPQTVRKLDLPSMAVGRRRRYRYSEVLRRLRGGDEERPEAWATRQEVVDHFRASLRVVDRWVGDGMPSATIAGRRLFKLSACEEWLRWTGVIDDERL